jgi:predicted O-methyltransferase YrrM
MTVLKRLKAATLEVVRRYHLAVPAFLDVYAGKPRRPGPVFAKEAQVLHALTRLLMPAVIVEIGVGGAASTLAFAEALRLNRHGRLISIDIDPWFIERAQMLLRTHGLSQYASIIAGRSTDPETRRRIVEQAPRIDILFIDGDHSFTGCHADFACYRDLLAPAGIVVFHDTAPFPAAEAAWVLSLPPDTGGGAPEWTMDGLGIYHRPDVAKVVEQIVRVNPDYSVLSLQTLCEPTCGMAILQKTQPLYQPKGSLRN